MGASFPLLSSLAISRHNREGSTVGKVYFFNIIGNVLGGVITGFILLPILNTETTLLAFGITGLLFVLFITGGSMPHCRKSIARPERCSNPGRPVLFPL